MANENTITQKVALTEGIQALKDSGYDNPPVMEKLEAMLETISKPRKKSDEPSKQTLMNRNTGATLHDALVGREPMTAKEIINLGIDGISSPQKVAALMKSYVPNAVKDIATVEETTEDGKTKKKKVTVYSVSE